MSSPSSGRSDRQAGTAGMVRLVAVGDICLARGVKQVVEKYGADFLFEKVRPALRPGDIVFGNLECVISRPHAPLEPARVDMLAPAFCADALAASGFTVLNIANNHIMDYGAAGLQETLDRLQAKKIAPLGAGRDERAARAPVVFEKNGFRTGFLGYADNSTGHSSRRNPSAAKRRAGIAAYDEKKILNDLAHLKKNADVVIVSLHVDLEFSEYPAPGRVRFCRKLIDNGALIVLQHHPHVPQGIELYKEGLIVYSLGNFVFPVAGNDYLLSNSAHCDESFILDVRFDKRKIAGLNVIPVRITGDHRPVPLTGEEGSRLTAYIAALSQPLRNPGVLAHLGFKTSWRMFKKTANQMKTGFLQLDASGLARTIVSLVLRSEHRRWIKELLQSLVCLRFLKPAADPDITVRNDKRTP